MSFTQDGIAIGERLEPKSPEELAEAVGRAGARGGALLVRGGGSRLGIGNPLRRADAVLETSGLARLLELDADDGVLQAEAGAPLARLRSEAERTGWEIPLDPPGGAATLGGALAAAAAGPCFPQPRDAVLGMQVALAAGTLVRFGGRVVKNVTGYDLAKLFVGSFGSLGVVTAAWIRLRPSPEARAVLAAPVPVDPSALLAAARRPSVRAAIALDAPLAAAVLPGAVGALLLLELAGDEPAVAADRAELAARIGAVACDDAALARAREWLGAEPPAGAPSHLALRLAVVPSAVPGAASALRAAGLELAAQPARGLVHARLALGSGAVADAEVAAACAAAREAAARGRGSFRIEAAPLAQKRGRDVFGPPGPQLALLRRLKAEYDPQGVLNPGRFAGHL